MRSLFHRSHPVWVGLFAQAIKRQSEENRVAAGPVWGFASIALGGLTSRKRRNWVVQSIGAGGDRNGAGGKASGSRFMRGLALRIGIPALAPTAILLASQMAAAQEPLTNVEIRMVKSSSSGPLRVTAETRNPNDFAVREVEMNCTIKDRRGNDLVSYRSTVLNVFQPNERKTTRNLSVGAWPDQGYAALCISTMATRVPSKTAPQ